MKVGVVGEIHPSGYEIFDKNNIEYINFLTKNIFESDRLVKLGKFQEKGNLPNYFELYNKKILILGFGRIGKALAKRCNGFEMEVYVHDPFLSDEEIKNQNCIPINKEDGFKICLLYTSDAADE